jgi:hypothetical protein
MVHIGDGSIVANTIHGGRSILDSIASTLGAAI